MEIKKIMLPVDGSDHSLRAAEYALKFAGLTKSEVLITHSHRPFPVTLGEPYFQRAIDKIMDKSNKLLEPYKEIFEKSDVPFIERVIEGTPGEVIPRIAEIESCDMIIMGSRGCSDLEGLLLGSVTHRVLSSAPCPVLVIR